MENLAQLLLSKADNIFLLFYLIFSSLMLRFTLIKSGQFWASTYAQTATIMILPVVTYVITLVISGNIALSLGMIGALSIVRFRNPVKSPLELVIFFFLITLGISAAVNITFSIFLLLSIIVILISLNIINFISLNYFKKPFFGVSFSEGGSKCILEVQATDVINELHYHKNLVSFVQEKNKRVYRLAATLPDELKELSRSLQNHASVENIQFSC